MYIDKMLSLKKEMISLLTAFLELVDNQKGHFLLRQTEI